jgi:hypothetical protein
MNAFRKTLIPAALLLSLALPACAQQKADAAGSNGAGQVLAVVNGKPVTEAEVRQSAADQFKALDREYQQNVHQLIENSLDAVVQDRLLDAEAASRKITKDQLLAEIKPAAVTDADVDAFYEQNKAQIPRPKEQVAAQIKSYLEQQGQQKAKTDYFKTLEAKYKVDYKLEPIRIQVAATGPRPSRRSRRSTATRCASSSASIRCPSTRTPRRRPRLRSAPSTRASSGRCTTPCSPTSRSSPSSSSRPRRPRWA